MLKASLNLLAWRDGAAKWYGVKDIDTSTVAHFSKHLCSVQWGKERGTAEV